ncbi:hypothetical protein M0805_008684, partial [Coniferiporia weirii]
VKYFWKTPFTHISFLYFLNRYLGLLEALVDVRSFTFGVTEALYVPSDDNELNNADLVRQVWFLGLVLRDFWCVLLALQSSHSDSHSVHFPGWIGILVIDAILLIRVIALYERSTKLTVCLSFLFVAEASVMLWCSARIQLSAGMTVVKIGDTTECRIGTDVPQLMSVLYWIPPTVFELALLVLSVRKGAEFWRERAGLKGFSRLMHVLLRDQVVYFILVLACGVASVILTYVKVGVVGVGTSFKFTNATALCILGSRILINLKEAAVQNVYASVDQSGSGTVLSDVRFT